MKRTLLISALVAFVGSAGADAKVLVGVSSALSGPMAWSGGETKQGAERAAADLNARGGVLG